MFLAGLGQEEVRRPEAVGRGAEAVLVFAAGSFVRPDGPGGRAL
jgi:hypothetical protein